MSALNKKSFLTWLKEGGIYVVLLVLLAIIIFQDPTFLSLLNLSNILTQSSVRIIIALGVAGLIVTQGTDLSALRPFPALTAAFPPLHRALWRWAVSGSHTSPFTL